MTGRIAVADRTMVGSAVSGHSMAGYAVMRNAVMRNAVMRNAVMLGIDGPEDDEEPVGGGHAEPNRKHDGWERQAARDDFVHTLFCSRRRIADCSEDENGAPTIWLNSWEPSRCALGRLAQYMPRFGPDLTSVF